MAPTASTALSNLSLALASKPRMGADNTASNTTDSTVGVGLAPSNNHAHPGLLTPPNSISPIIPPQLSNNHHQPPHSVDSDVDLQDAVDYVQHQDQPHSGHPLSHDALAHLNQQESQSAITPAVLAELHLPHILLGRGPVPIRYITSYLTQSLPGFVSIPPAKARRIIVSALEGRYHGGNIREVVYDKVGWGRWEARMKGQPMSDARPAEQNNRTVSPPVSVASSTAASHTVWNDKTDMNANNIWANDTVMTPPAEAMDMAAYEADKMSLDGNGDSDFEEPPISEDDDETEEEDWAAIGAEALRNGYYTKSANQRYRKHAHNKPTKPCPIHDKQNHHHRHVARSAPSHSSHPYEKRFSNPYSRHHKTSKPSKIVYINSSNIDEQNAQERAAAEALLRMVSM